MSAFIAGWLWLQRFSEQQNGKKKIHFHFRIPPNPSRYLPPRKHICSGEIISVDPKFKIHLKKLNSISPFWIRIKDLDYGWDEDWWSLMSQLHPQNVSQWQYQTMNGGNVMFDQWHIQYCLILRMTLMLQRQHHLPERILFIECNLVHRAMDHYHSIVWPLVYCNSIREALNRRDRPLNAGINLFQNIALTSQYQTFSPLKKNLEFIKLWKDHFFCRQLFTRFVWKKCANRSETRQTLYFVKT